MLRLAERWSTSIIDYASISFCEMMMMMMIMIVVIIIIITTEMFIVLSSWHNHCDIVRVHPVHFMNANSAPRGHQPLGLANRFELWICLLFAAIHTYRHHLLLLLNPKADTHFTVPRRVEGLSGSTGTAVRVCDVQRALAVVVNTTPTIEGFDPAISHTTSNYCDIVSPTFCAAFYSRAELLTYYSSSTRN